MWSLALGLLGSFGPKLVTWLGKAAPWLAAGAARELQQRQQRAAARRVNHARARQVDDALARPRDRDDLVRRLRDDGQL